MIDLTRYFSRRRTPQDQPIPGEAQVPNSAGGHVYGLDDAARLERFLVLGTEGGTYYASERELTLEQAEVLVRLLDRDGLAVVDTVVAVSEAGRAAKVDPALFALAVAAGVGDDRTRAAALAALPRVARTGAHLFRFVHFVQSFRGWGRALKRAVGDWYQARAPEALAYQAVKYRQRGGWSHRDLLRLARPRPADEAHQDLYRWITQGVLAPGLPRILEGYSRAAAATSVRELVPLIREYRLPREAVPTEFLRATEVWDALLEDMPLTAMIRNLGTMSKVGLITELSGAAGHVAARLGDREALRRARVHPVQVLSALVTYRAGRGARGKGTWSPVRAVVDALDAAFHASFEAVVPTGKRWLLALDVSGSMGATFSGIPGLSCRVASAAMAMVTAAVEDRFAFRGFSHELIPLDISPRQRLDDVVAAISGLAFGATDCALPMVWAREAGVEVDVFAVYTDNETWYGKIHPAQALREYRDATGIPARLVVAGMASNGFSIADPADPGMLDVVSFDTRAPRVLADFAGEA